MPSGDFSGTTRRSYCHYLAHRGRHHAMPHTVDQFLVKIGQRLVKHAVQTQVDQADGATEDVGGDDPGVALPDLARFYSLLHDVSHCLEGGGTADRGFIGQKLMVFGMQYVGDDIALCFSVFKEQVDDAVAALPKAQILGDDILNQLLHLPDQMVEERLGNALFTAEMVVDRADADVGLFLDVVYRDVVKALFDKEIEGCAQNTGVHRGVGRGDFFKIRHAGSYRLSFVGNYNQHSKKFDKNEYSFYFSF